MRVFTLFRLIMPMGSSMAKEEVGWEHREVRVMGRRVMQPRLVAYMADDPSLCYTYSGLTLPTLPWSPAVAEVKVIRQPCDWQLMFSLCP